MVFPDGISGKKFNCQCRRHGFDPWVWKIPWRRKWQPTPVLLLGEFHGQRSLAGYRPGAAKSQDWVTNTFTFNFFMYFSLNWSIPEFSLRSLYYHNTFHNLEHTFRKLPLSSTPTVNLIFAINMVKLKHILIYDVEMSAAFHLKFIVQNVRKQLAFI